MPLAPWSRFPVSAGTNPGSLADDFFIRAELNQTEVLVCGFDGPNAGSLPAASGNDRPAGEWVFFVLITRPPDA